MKILFILLVTTGAVLGLPKVDPRLTKLLGFGGIGGGKANVMITLANTTDVILAPFLSMQSAGQAFASRDELLNAVTNALQAHAAVTQAPVIQTLAQFIGLDFTAYWVSNQIFLPNVDTLVVSVLERLPSVARIEAEFFVQLTSSRPSFENLIPSSASASTRQGTTNTWGVTKIRAPDVWNMGYTGQGVVVGGIDTGVRGSHSSFKSRFVGEYGWYDPIARTPTPNDQQGHGTHTMGTIVGSGGIGVAPGAKWMACKGCTTTGCSNNALTACGQFMQCPTLTNGSRKDCSKAPMIVSNSWGGGQGQTWYNSIVNAWRAAGIIPVFSIGNSGPNCGTANSPGDQPNLIAVGATDSSDTLASYSSIGPARSGATKPDIAAPGSSTVSASHTSDTGTATKSGTSMSCPHVAGVIALMKSKNLNLSYDDIYKHITNTADRTGLRAAGKNCGGKSDTSTWPNNSFGYGRINALNAIQAF